MNAPSDEPLHKTLINLYKTDVDYMKKKWGQGWSTIVRELIRSHIKALKYEED